MCSAGSARHWRCTASHALRGCHQGEDSKNSVNRRMKSNVATSLRVPTATVSSRRGHAAQIRGGAIHKQGGRAKTYNTSSKKKQKKSKRGGRESTRSRARIQVAGLASVGLCARGKGCTAAPARARECAWGAGGKGGYVRLYAQGSFGAQEQQQALKAQQPTAACEAHGLHYSSHTTRSGLDLARVVRRFVWPRHADSMLSTTPLDPCACELGA